MTTVEKVFFDDNRQVDVTYKIEPADIGCEVAKDIMNAFASITGHYNSRSRNQAWRAVKKFIGYLKQIDFSEETENVDVVSGFADHLKSESRLKKTNGTHYVLIKRLVKVIAESSSSPAWFNQGLEFKDFSREVECNRSNVVSVEDLRNISAACKKSINEIINNFSLREKVQQKGWSNDSNYSNREIENLKKLIELEREGLWSQRQLGANGYATLGASGLRKLTNVKELTFDSIIPIFLLITIQTAANPVSLMEINKNCILDNPLDPLSVILEWDKKRSSKMQKVSLLRAGKFSVANLVALTQNMTAPIRHLACPADSELLFITRSGGNAKRVSVQSLHNKLKEFREANNLTYFTFADIRRAVAELIYAQTGSEEDAARALQHKEKSTTRLYLKSDVSAQKAYARIAEFQGQMLLLVENHQQPEFDTVLGFKCSAPLSGVASGSKKGEPCMEFLSCATCKNAIVPIDDPHTVGRIVRAQKHLIKLGNASQLDHEDRERFEKIYKPILNIINNEVLNKVPSETMKVATRLSTKMGKLPVMV